MMIHKQLLTHDGVTGATAGKVIDLGFNGDFDIKNHRWNMVFLALPAGTYDNAPTLTVKTLKPIVYAGGELDEGTLVMKDGCIYECVATSKSKATWDEIEWRKYDLDDAKTVFDGDGDDVREIGSVEIPADIAAKGGAFGIVMPKGLGRYFTLAVTNTGSVAVTAGITDMVDTDINPGIDWTYYKADTHEVCQPGRIEKAMETLG